MSISVSSVFEIRTAGSDTNGGGFKSGASGTDYSQQNAKNTVGSDISTTDAVGNGTTTLTSATANFGTSIIGNIIYLQGGTGSLAAGWYEVTARASTTSITLDRAVGTGINITMNIGGALASLGRWSEIFAGQSVSGTVAWVKSGTYTINLDLGSNVSGGYVNSGFEYYAIGYDSTRGDYGTRPVLDYSYTGSSFLYAFNTGGSSTANCFVGNFDIDLNNLSTVGGPNLGAGVGYRIILRDHSNNGFVLGFNGGGNCWYIECESVGDRVSGTNGAFYFVNAINCIARDGINGGRGFFAAGNSDMYEWINCLAYNNSGPGFGLSGHGRAIGCTSYGNTGAGFYTPGSPNRCRFINCLAVNNTTWGFDFSPGSAIGSPDQVLLNCATYNNTSGGISIGTYGLNRNPITLSGDPFTNAASRDFSLNNTAGAGAALRAAGYGAFSGGLTTSYPDVGAAQALIAAATPGHNFSAAFG